ncbi:MAG: hypothetical protein JST30_15435 [Armatimonadetes bacterium]|nr:hypothetical protein [Armatimonadota bacterium]
MPKTFRSTCILASIAGATLASAQPVTLWTNKTANRLNGMNGWSNVRALPDGDFVACTTVQEQSLDRKTVVRCWGPNGATRWTYENNAFNPNSVRLAVEPGGTVAVIDVDSTNAATVRRIDAQGVETDSAPASTDIHDFVAALDVAPDGKIYASLKLTVLWGFTYTLIAYRPDLTVRWSSSTLYDPHFVVLPNGRLAACGTDTVQTGAPLVIVFNTDGTEHARFQLNALSVPVDIAADSQNEVFVCDGLGKVHKFDGDLNALGNVQTDATSSEAKIAYHEPSDTLYVVDAESVDDLLVQGYSGALVQKWGHTEPENLSPFARIELELDRFGNALIGTTDESLDTFGDMKVFCFDPRGRSMWENALGTFQGTSESLTGLAVNSRLQVVAVGGTNDGLDDFGLAWRTTQYFHVPPDSATLRIGWRTAGNAASLAQEDGDEYTVCKFVVPNLTTRPIIYELDTEFPINDVNPNVTDVTLRARARASTPGLGIVLQLYNWQTGTWTVTNNDPLFTGIRSFTRTYTNVGRYFQSGTTRLKARIAVAPIGPVSTNAFCIATDLFEFQSNTQ